ncbi:hypothetical protein Tco_0415800 [Tanacetum coccineum]
MLRVEINQIQNTYTRPVTLKGTTSDVQGVGSGYVEEMVNASIDKSVEVVVQGYLIRRDIKHPKWAEYGLCGLLDEIGQDM